MTPSPKILPPRVMKVAKKIVYILRSVRLNHISMTQRMARVSAKGEVALKVPRIKRRF